MSKFLRFLRFSIEKPFLGVIPNKFQMPLASYFLYDTIKNKYNICKMVYLIPQKFNFYDTTPAKKIKAKI